MSSDSEEKVDNWQQTVDLTSTSNSSVQGDDHDSGASLLQRLNSTGSGNRSLLSLLPASTESGHSDVSSMLYITSSQPASPSFGPINPDDEANIGFKNHKGALPMIIEEFEGGRAAIPTEVASSKRYSVVPSRRPLYQNNKFEPQVLSYDLEQEHKQDVPMPYPRFARDRDVTLGEWSTLRKVCIYTTTVLKAERLAIF